MKPEKVEMNNSKSRVRYSGTDFPASRSAAGFLVSRLRADAQRSRESLDAARLYFELAN